MVGFFVGTVSLTPSNYILPYHPSSHIEGLEFVVLNAINFTDNHFLTWFNLDMRIESFANIVKASERT